MIGIVFVCKTILGFIISNEYYVITSLTLTGEFTKIDVVFRLIVKSH